MFAFLQCPGTSLDCHDLPSMTENGLAMTPASSLSVHGCILLRPMDLGILSLTKWSLTQLKQGEIFLSPDLLPGLLGQRFLKAGLGSEDRSKKTCSISAFSTTYVTIVPFPFSSEPTFSLLTIFLLMCLKKPFSLSLTTLARFNSRWALAYFIEFLHTLTLFL